MQSWLQRGPDSSKASVDGAPGLHAWIHVSSSRAVSLRFPAEAASFQFLISIPKFTEQVGPRQALIDFARGTKKPLPIWTGVIKV